MSLFSTYRLRIILVVTAILIIGSISTVSYLTIALDNNIETLEDAEHNYHEMDESILSKMNELQSSIERVIREELVQNVEVILGGSLEVIEANVSEINALINSIKNELALRLSLNYDIGDINYGILNTSVAGVTIPRFSDIITTGAESASEVFLVLENRVESNSATSLSSVLDDLFDIRSNFDTVLGSLDNDLNSINTQNDAMRDIIDTMVQKAVGLADETEAINTLESLFALSEALEDFVNVYTAFVVDFQSDPINFNVEAYQDEITSENQSLHEAIDDFRTVANVATFTEIDNFELNLDVTFSDVMNSSLTTVITIQTEYANILDKQDIILNNFRLDALNSLNATLTIVEQESSIFEQRISGVVNDMVDRRQLLNSQVFVFLDIFVFLALGYVTWILTRGIGRITTKNVKFAQGDLTGRVRKSYSNNEMGRLEESLDTTIAEMRTIISSVTQTSETLAGISEELAAGAEEASASINDVSSTVREFSSGSSEQSIMLNRVRNELLTHLDVVESTANQIDETAKFVLQVAKRTNILGLNASIEAAKAGRFGLGFDVVAEEVRSLSDETRESASRIASSIEEIEFTIQQTVEDILNEVNIIREVAENTAAGSEEASAATSEQVTMMNEISQTSSQLSELSQTLNSLLQRFTV